MAPRPQQPNVTDLFRALCRCRSHTPMLVPVLKKNIKEYYRGLGKTIASNRTIVTERDPVDSAFVRVTVPFTDGTTEEVRFAIRD